jgi:hypothetical protein
MLNVSERQSTATQPCTKPDDVIIIRNRNRVEN